MSPKDGAGPLSLSLPKSAVLMSVFQLQVLAGPPLPGNISEAKAKLCLSRKVITVIDSQKKGAIRTDVYGYNPDSGYS